MSKKSGANECKLNRVMSLMGNITKLRILTELDQKYSENVVDLYQCIKH